MAFFALLWKARNIEKYKLNYEKEKINSIVMGNTRMEQTLSQRWRHYRYDTQKRISSTFKKWYPEGSAVANFFLYLKTDQTFPNFLLKSLMGFVGGIILTYICFMFFVFQLSISLIHSTIMSSIIGVLLTLGLAFSYRIRCLVFLLIPQFFSRVGRYTLTCYALVLILTGPATNTLKNSEVLSESMACSQEQIKTSVHHLNDLTMKPQSSMKESIKLMVERFKAITTRVQQMVVRLNRLVFSIVGLIQYSFSWLQAISNICNEKLRSPYDRCTTLLQDGIDDCKKNSDPNIEMHCNVAYLAQIVCGAVKPFKAFCCVTDFMDDAILANIRKKLKDFTAQIRALFHVEVHIHRSYSFKSNNTRSASQIAAGIVTEIRNRTGPLLTWLSWSSCVTSLFLLLIIFRAKYYQHMFETRSRFDNRYITRELQELDLKRQRQGRETVLPLNRRERAKYITTTSFRLVASEKMYLTRSAVFMLITTFKLLIHIVADYSLYWVLMTIRYHGQYQSNLMPGVPYSGAHVTGSGFVARLLRSIVDTFTIPLAKPAPSLIPCLPDPYPPDFRRYTQIGVLIFLLWFFALFEPYGLRLRHLIMGQYRPERARARANWLYNHILRTRAGFMKFARRKLHRKYKYSTESSLTFRHWLNDHIPFQWLKYLLGLGPKEPHCLLCGTRSSFNDSDTQLTRCETPRCPGVYCTNCFCDIGQLCTICLSPNEYGDLSDFSLERGSSDDDESGSEFDESLNRSERTRLLENENQSNHTSNNSEGTARRWNFFISSQQPHNNYEYNDIGSADKPNYTGNKNMYTNTLNNGQINETCLLRQKKFQSHYLELENDSKKYEFSIDFNNNIILKPPKGDVVAVIKTRSIGTNTEKRFCFMPINFKNIVERFIIYRCQSIKQVKKVLKPTLNKKTISDTDIVNLKFNLNKYISVHNNVNSSLNFQINTKHITKSKRDNRTYIFKNIKRNCIQGFNQNNCSLNHTNESNKEKHNNEGKHSFHNMKPVMSSTPKNNDTNKNVKNNKRKAKDIKKDSKDIEQKKNKKNGDGDKPKKPSKDKLKKASHHRIAKFNTFLFNRWRSVKSKIDYITNRHVGTVITKEKKNHKRRKKRKDKVRPENKEKRNHPEKENKNCPENKKKESNAKKESKRARSYRIAAFLADHDWMKRDYKKPNRLNMGSDDSCRVIKAPSCRVIPPNCNKNKLVAMVQLGNTPFQWRQTRRWLTESVMMLPCNDRNTNINIMKSKSQACLKKKSSYKALERFKRKVNAPVPSPAPSLVKEMMNSMNLIQKPSIDVAPSSICIKKRPSFYNAFKREALKLENRGTLNAEELYKNDGFSEYIIPLEFNPELSEKSTGPRIEKNLSLSSPNLEKIDSNRTDLSKKTTLMSCRFNSCKDMIRKWNHNKKPSAKNPSDHTLDVTQMFKNLCTSLLGSSCNGATCKRRRQRVTEHKPPEGRASNVPILSKDSDLIHKKSVITRTCDCESYEDLQRKWTHINNPPPVYPSNRKFSMRHRLKRICSSLFASGCNEKTCVNHKDRERLLSENRYENEALVIAQSKSKTKTIQNSDLKILQDRKSTLLDNQEARDDKISISLEPELKEKAQLKEIQRHIDREKEIQRDILLEQKRHKDREMQIQKEFGYELAKHKETENKLMCDEDSQTLQGENIVDFGTNPASTIRKEEVTKTMAVGSFSCQCVDKNEGGTAPSKKKSEKKIKEVTSVASTVISRKPSKKSMAVGSYNYVRTDKKVGQNKMRTCSCATQYKNNTKNRLSSDVPQKNIPPQRIIEPPRKSLSPSPRRQRSPSLGLRPSWFSMDQGYSDGECCRGCTKPKDKPPDKKKFCGCDCSTQCSVLGVKTLYCEETTSPRFTSNWVSPMHLSSVAVNKPQPPQEKIPLAASLATQVPDTDKAVPSCGSKMLLENSDKKKRVEYEKATQYSNPDVKSRFCEETTSPRFVSNVVSPMHLPLTALNRLRTSQEHLPDATSPSSRIPQAEEAVRCKRSKRLTGEVKTKITYLPQHKNSAKRDQCRIRNPSTRTLSRRYSPERYSQRITTQPSEPLQTPPHSFPSPLIILSPESSQSPPSPLLVMTSRSGINRGVSQHPKYRGQPQLQTKVHVPRQYSPPTVRVPDGINDAHSFETPSRDRLESNSYVNVSENKSILANFSEEYLPSKARFRDVAVQIKLTPEFTHKKSSPNKRLIRLPNVPISEDYSCLGPCSSYKVDGRRNKPREISAKCSNNKYRCGIEAQEYYTNKDSNDTGQYHYERREKTRPDRSASHRGLRYTYCWKRFGKKNSVMSKDSTKRRRLSLESSLFDMGNNSNDLNEDSDSNLASQSRVISDEDMRTDTTCCSMATVRFDDRVRRCARKVKFTCNHQATSTEKTTVRDAGTLTCDWWSPLVERKVVNPFEKSKGKDIEDIRRGTIDLQRRKLKTNDGRYVKFKSGTQIIPPCKFDLADLNIMTPSRYILESQKYYNELYAYSADTPRPDLRYHQRQTQKVHDREKVCSPIGSRRAYQRKTKKQDENSPRKSQFSPRKRFTDSIRTSESPRIKPSIYRKTVKRYYAKLNASKKS